MATRSTYQAKSINQITCEITVTKKSGTVIGFKEVVSVKVEESYDTLTNTAEVVIPRDNRWIKRDENGFNYFQVMKSDGLFELGDAIHIKLGYDFNNETVFQGYITGIEPKSPFTLICEDAMWLLKRNRINLSFPNNESNKLSDFIDKLLVNGVELHPDSFIEDIIFGKIYIRNISTAQLLDKWKKEYGIISYIRDNKLLIGRSFFTSGESNLFRVDSDYVTPVIDVERDVPKDEDNLKLTTLDGKFLALRAVSMFPNNKKLAITIILDPDDLDNILVIDLDDTRKSKEEREAIAKQLESMLAEKAIDLESYQTRTLHEFNLDKDALYQSAKSAFSKYVCTGFEGEIMTFGDYNFKAGKTVYLFDPKNCEKNGEYIIKSVTKTFGPGGYRQVLTIPHKVRDL